MGNIHSHVCRQLQEHIQQAPRQPGHSGTNEATADAVEKENGIWYLVVNAYEYAIPIRHCPFCGARLK